MLNDVSTSDEIDWFRTAFERTPLGMAHVTLDRKIVRVNPALCRMLGRSAESITQVGISGLTHPDDADLHISDHIRLVAGEIDEYRVTKRYLHANGSIVWTNLSVAMVRDNDGNPRSLVSQLENITARVEADNKLQWLAAHDALTGLRNRGGFFREVEQRSREQLDDSAVIYLDLDGFKQINDKYGHHAGDQVIATVGDRIRELIPDQGVAARFGGDEFVIHVSADQARVLAESILANLRRSIDALPLHLITASIGIADGRSITIDETIRRADTAMYRAKCTGPGLIEPSSCR